MNGVPPKKKENDFQSKNKSQELGAHHAIAKGGGRGEKAEQERKRDGGETEELKCWGARPCWEQGTSKCKKKGGCWGMFRCGCNLTKGGSGHGGKQNDQKYGEQKRGEFYNTEGEKRISGKGIGKTDELGPKK